MFTIVKLDNYEPIVGSQTFDLVANNIVDPDAFDIPVWLSVTYWIVTEDVAAIAEGFSISVNYVDPTGTTRTIAGTPISLGIAEGIFVLPVTPIQRQSASSLVELVATRSAGGAGAPIVSARIMASRLNYEHIPVQANWTP